MTYQASMKIIKPTTISDVMLTSSSIAEPSSGEVLWAAGTAYTVGQKAIRTTTHTIYERLVAGTTATLPENDAVNWLPIGPTNKWAMFDRKVGTISSNPTSLTVVINSGPISGLALLNIVGSTVSVTMKDAPGGTTIYSKTIALEGTEINTVYDWFFTEYEQLSDLVLTDLPETYTNPQLTVTISTSVGSVSIGNMQIGKVINVGSTQFGATAGINDYSKKTVDVFGNIDVIERSYSKRTTLQCLTDRIEFSKIYKSIASIRAIPCVYIGVDAEGFDPFIVYGYFKDFSIVVAYPDHHLCNLEIEGLV